MNAGRRNLLRFVGGAAAGVMITPAPWKLINDSALWSQNWSWIPKLPSGPRTVKYTTCTLCPAGCGVEARCVGEQPYGLVGVTGHPLSNGTLCPLGVGAHHLPYHPRRASFPLKRGPVGKHVPVSFDTAIAEISHAIEGRGRGTTLAVLDERPGRTLSLVYRRFLGGFSDAVYLTPPAHETVTLSMLSRMTDSPAGSLGFDIASSRAAISFGAPLLDGWGIPAQVNAARYRAGSPMKIVQVETKQSRTASLADLWLAPKPGTEAAVAMAIANVLVNQNLVPAANLDRAAGAAEYRELIGQFPPEAVAAITGIPPETIVAAAQMLAVNLPAVAIGGGDAGGGAATASEETAIAGLNLLLGAFHTPGGIMPRQEPPVPKEWNEWKLAPHSSIADVPDHSIAVLILGDSPSGDALPWTLIAKKLVPGKGLVVSLAPFVEGPSRHADYILPAAAFLETLEEVPTPPTATTASLSIAAALLPVPKGVVEPALVLSRLSGTEIALGPLLEQRAAAIQESKRGIVTDAAGSKPVTDFKTGDELWKALVAGGTWTAELVASKPPVHVDFQVAAISQRVLVVIHPASPADAAFPLALTPYAWRGASGSSVLPPLFTKVYQESLLRGSAIHCRVHPSTAAEAHVRDGDKVLVETRCGSCEQRAWLDASVMPGVIEVPAGPQGSKGDYSVLDVCALDDGGTWRSSGARIRRMS